MFIVAWIEPEVSPFIRTYGSEVEEGWSAFIRFTKCIAAGYSVSVESTERYSSSSKICSIGWTSKSGFEVYGPNDKNIERMLNT